MARRVRCLPLDICNAEKCFKNVCDLRQVQLLVEAELDICLRAMVIKRLALLSCLFGKNFVDI